MNLSHDNSVKRFRLSQEWFISGTVKGAPMCQPRLGIMGCSKSHVFEPPQDRSLQDLLTLSRMDHLTDTPWCQTRLGIMGCTKSLVFEPLPDRSLQDLQTCSRMDHLTLTVKGCHPSQGIMGCTKLHVFEPLPDRSLRDLQALSITDHLTDTPWRQPSLGEVHKITRFLNLSQTDPYKTS